MDFSEVPSLYSFPSPQISDEEFKLFHTIDRMLFTRLVIGLGRDPDESMQVVAFWLWLEQAGNDMVLVKKVLNLPPPLVNEAAEETAACLKCVKADGFPFTEVELALLPNLVKKYNLISATYLQENRTNVLRLVMRYVNKVCFKAFDDILLLAVGGRPVVGSTYEHGQSSRAAAEVPPVAGRPSVRRGVQRHPNTCYASPLGKMGYPLTQAVGPIRPLGLTRLKTGSPPLVSPVRVAPPPPQMNNEIAEMINRPVEDKEETVHPDDRTIFLTFSKGYPISQQEVTDFFSRKFGDSIEAIHMQEVASGEQVLYARLVARTVAALEAIVVGGKAKYNINGKHVWARKYVKKHSAKLLSSSSSSSSSPPSPVADAPPSSKP